MCIRARMHARMYACMHALAQRPAHLGNPPAAVARRQGRAGHHRDRASTERPSRPRGPRGSGVTHCRAQWRLRTSAWPSAVSGQNAYSTPGGVGRVALLHVSSWQRARRRDVDGVQHVSIGAYSVLHIHEPTRSRQSSSPLRPEPPPGIGPSEPSPPPRSSRAASIQSAMGATALDQVPPAGPAPWRQVLSTFIVFTNTWYGALLLLLLFPHRAVEAPASRANPLLRLRRAPQTKGASSSRRAPSRRTTSSSSSPNSPAPPSPGSRLRVPSSSSRPGS